MPTATQRHGDDTLPGQPRGGAPTTGAAATSDPTSPAPEADRELIGRRDELAALRRHLREHALVTVTGTGGVGKTSLALTAVQSAGAGRTRVVVCELAEVEAADAVRHAVVARLQVVLQPGAPIGSALTAPADGGHLLVVLDSCEHVLAAAADVVEELLAAGPYVRVLATSREPLHLPGEHVLVLGPLAVPASPADPAAADSPAVALFARRARQVDAGFVLDERTLPDVVRICRCLDGVPLSLEIAAARVRALAVRDIADRLATPFRLLRTGARRTPDRHRSVRAVVDWSYGLLTDAERQLLTAMAVYPGGFDLDAATAAAVAAGLPEADVIDLLHGLVAKSLMTVDVSRGRTRYGMLETMRAYGLERLEESGRLRRARDGHADHYAALARRVRANALRSWTDELLELSVEFDNVRAAVLWTVAEDTAPDRAFDLLAPLCYVGLLQRAEEVAVLTDRALDRWPETGHPRWSEVAATGANALFTLQEHERSRSRARAAVEAVSSTVGAALAWGALAGISTSHDHDSEAALRHLDRADAAAAATDFAPYRCEILGLRAELLAQARRPEEAVAAAERALAVATAQGHRYTHAWALQLVGMLHVTTQPAAAREWLEAALAESQAADYPYGICSALRGLAVLCAEEGDLGTAAALFRDVLSRIARDGFLAERWHTVAAALPLLVRAGRRDVAATLLVGVTGTGAAVSRLHAPLYDDVCAELAPELSSPRVRARARALRPDQLLALTDRELHRLADPGTAPDRTTGLDRTPAAMTPAVTEPAATTGELRRVGELWRVTFAGSTVHLPDSKGMRDLAVLLASPGREVPALDLFSSAVGGAPAATVPAAAVAGAEGLGATGDLGERIDAQARAAYAARVRELQEELDEADAAGDAERGARAQQELDFLTRELTTAYGLRGPRRTGDPAEKARTAVTMRVRAAIGKAERAHPALGAHLRGSVRTGRFCGYHPEQPTTWHVAR